MCASGGWPFSCFFVVSSSVFLRVTSRADLYKSNLAKVSNDENGRPNEMGTLPDCEPNSIKFIEDSSAKMMEPTGFCLFR